MSTTAAVISQGEERMKKALQQLHREFQSIRTGEPIQLFWNE